MTAPGEPGASLTEFYGTVLVKSWMQVPWREGVTAGFTGHCALVASKDAFGFDVNNRDSTWAVVVHGKNTSIGIPGCEVKMMFRQNAEEQTFGANPDIEELP